MSEWLTRLTPMRAITEMRAVVDAFAARYAAARVAAGADKRPLLDAFKHLGEASRSGNHHRVTEADRALHMAVVHLAGVEGLVQVWEAAANAQEVFRAESIARCWPDLNVLFEGHRALVDAICAGDTLAAEDAAHGHLDAVWYRLAEMRGDSSLSDAPLARACTYLEFHLQEPVRLDFLARFVAKTSTGHLARLFREEFACSFTEYLRELRMHKAVKLLTDSSQPIGRIAALVGYADASRFSQHFRRRFGISPRAYRQRFAERRGTGGG